jgi:branched-chain amino acid transport system ATP-binding protein
MPALISRLRRQNALESVADPSGLLLVSGLHAGYGRAEVLFDVGINVGTSEAVALLGANGAGKTTLLRAISGVVRVRSGRVLLANKNLTNAPSERIVREGISHVPQGRGLFPSLTTEENVRAGGYLLDRRVAEQRTDELFATMFPQLQSKRRQFAGRLSGGEQQMVALMRGLIASPRLLLLDEPTLGLSPVLRDEVLASIDTARAAGVGVLVVEQNARHVLARVDRCCVMRSGRIVYAASAADALSSYEDLAHEYLGTGSIASA